MKTAFTTFQQLNDYLEKTTNKLILNPETSPAIQEKIQRVIQENLEIVKDYNRQEVERYIHFVKLIDLQNKKAGTDTGLVRMAIDAVAFNAYRLGEKKCLKELDESIYYKAKALYISDEKKNIKSLKLSEEKLLKVIPWVTYLDLTDASNERLDDCTFTDDFIEKILEKAINLEELILSRCTIVGRVFSRKEILQNLKTLEISECPNLNVSLEGLINLEDLYIFDCEVFNGRIPNLKTLHLRNCPAYDQPFDDLQNTHTMQFDNCPSLNQSFASMQSLHILRIFDCPAFEIKDLDTVRVLLKCTPEQFEELIANNAPDLNVQIAKALIKTREEHLSDLSMITPEMGDDLSLLSYLKIPKEKLVEQFKQLPLLPLILSIHEIDGLVREGKDPEIIKESFVSFKQKADDDDNFFDALRIVLQAFPDLTSFLIHHMKEEIVPDLKNLLEFDHLPLESKMALLPLLTPNQIRETVLEVPEETRAMWLDEGIEFEQFFGSVRDVLAQVVESNIQDADHQLQDNLLVTLKEFIPKIPCHILAALASADPETLFAYTFVMEEPQIASAIPLIPEEAFIQHLKTQPNLSHRKYMLYATTEQKEAYLDHDLLQEPESLTEWDQSWILINSLIDQFEREKTQDNYKSLESAWWGIVNKTNISLQTYHQSGQSLKKMLLDPSPSVAFENKVSAYFDPKMKHAAEVLQALKATGKKIEELEGQIAGIAKMPEKFIDDITGNVMEDPHYHPEMPNYILDRSTWQMQMTHPATRKTFFLQELIPDTELKTQIDAFKKEHPELWNK